MPQFPHAGHGKSNCTRLCWSGKFGQWHAGEVPTRSDSQKCSMLFLVALLPHFLVAPASQKALPAQEDLVVLWSPSQGHCFVWAEFMPQRLRGLGIPLLVGSVSFPLAGPETGNHSVLSHWALTQCECFSTLNN